MRKNLLLLLLIAATALSGCEKDDVKEEEKEEPAKATIVGKWYVKKTIFTRYENDVKKEEEIETDFNNNDYFEFKADGTGSFSDKNDLDILTYTVTGDIITLTDNPGESFDLKIKTLTTTDAVLVEESTETYQGIVYRHVEEKFLKK